MMHHDLDLKLLSLIMMMIQLFSFQLENFFLKLENSRTPVTFDIIGGSFDFKFVEDRTMSMWKCRGYKTFTSTGKDTLLSDLAQWRR